MVCGVGIGTELALNGAAAHAFAHILYKAVLFMGAGAVLAGDRPAEAERHGRALQDDAASRSASTWLAPSPSRPCRSSAASSASRWSFPPRAKLTGRRSFSCSRWRPPERSCTPGSSFRTTCSSARTRGLRGQEPPANMLVAMGLAAAACVLIGVFPALLYSHLPYPVDYVPYTVRHVTALWGCWASPRWGSSCCSSTWIPSPAISLDTDWFYRRGSSAVLAVVQWRACASGGLRRADLRGRDAAASCWASAALTARARYSCDRRRRRSASADSTQALSQGLRTAVSGNAQHYGLIMAAGVLAAIALAVFGR